MAEQEYKHIIITSSNSNSAASELKHAYTVYDTAIDHAEEQLEHDNLNNLDRIMGLTSSYVSQLVNRIGMEETIEIMMNTAKSLEEGNSISEQFQLTKEQKNKLN